MAEMQRYEGGMTPQRSGGLVRESALGGREMEVRSAAAMAVAEREKATIQALFLLAERRPRDWDTVRVKLLKESQRFRFADAAIWEMPRGGKMLEGPSIRLAEAALRAMGNAYVDTKVTHDDQEERRVLVEVIDLENLLRFSREITVAKTVERKTLPKGVKQLRERYNSFGDRVYIVEATNEEVLQKQQVEVSKAIRTEGLRLLPADILEEVIDACNATLESKTREDPDAAKKKLSDGFAKLNVLPDALAKYLGHPIAQCSPAELQNLRGLYQAISQGQTTWAQLVAEKEQSDADAAPIPPTKAPAPAPAAPSAPAASRVVEAPPQPAATQGGPATAAEPPPPARAAPASDDPDSYADTIIENIRSAATLATLKGMADAAKQVPEDRYLDVSKAYTDRRNELTQAAKATK